MIYSLNITINKSIAFKQKFLYRHELSIKISSFMESRDRIGKVLLVTLVLILAFVAYKRTNSAPAAVTYVEDKATTKSLLVKDDVEKIVRDFILNNPDVIIESIEKMHRRKVDEMNVKTGELIKSRKSDLENDKMSPLDGTGNNKIVVIYDYGCSYCRKANSVIDKLLETDKDVKVIYKPYPILGDSSEYISKVILSVYKLFPNKFKLVHSAMMMQKISSRDDVVRILELHNIPVANVEAEFDSQEIKDSLNKTANLANDLKIQGVPVFIINDTLYPGLLDLDRLQALLAEMRKNAPQEAESVEPAPALEEVKPSTDLESKKSDSAPKSDIKQ